MGYDCSMRIDTGGEYPAEVCEIGNHTSNCAGMWSTAITSAYRTTRSNFPVTSLKDLDNTTGADLIEILTKAVNHIEDPANQALYVAMNPCNGWGNHESATKYLRSILVACEEHPKATLHISD